MRRVVLLLAVIGTFGCQGYDDPRLPPLEVPFCATASSAEDRTAAIGLVDDSGEFAPIPDDAEDPPVCPVADSWRSMSAPTFLRVFGLQPKGVQGVITWTLEGEPVGEHDFTVDLLCPAGDTVAEPIPLPIAIGEQYGRPEFYVDGRPGTISVRVTIAGQDPRTCDPSTDTVRCLSLERSVSYTLTQ